MMDFRARRKEAAVEKGWAPGVVWEYRVDGKLFKAPREKCAGKEKWRVNATVEVAIGEVQFADDVALAGEEGEQEQAMGDFWGDIRGLGS